MKKEKKEISQSTQLGNSINYSTDTIAVLKHNGMGGVAKWLSITTGRYEPHEGRFVSYYLCALEVGSEPLDAPVGLSKYIYTHTPTHTKINADKRSAI